MGAIELRARQRRSNGNEAGLTISNAINFPVTLAAARSTSRDFGESSRRVWRDVWQVLARAVTVAAEGVDLADALLGFQPDCTMTESFCDASLIVFMALAFDTVGLPLPTSASFSLRAFVEEPVARLDVIRSLEATLSANRSTASELAVAGFAVRFVRVEAIETRSSE